MALGFRLALPSLLTPSFFVFDILNIHEKETAKHCIHSRASLEVAETTNPMFEYGFSTALLCTAICFGFYFETACQAICRIQLHFGRIHAHTSPLQSITFGVHFKSILVSRYPSLLTNL